MFAVAMARSGIDEKGESGVIGQRVNRMLLLIGKGLANRRQV